MSTYNLTDFYPSVSRAARAMRSLGAAFRGVTDAARELERVLNAPVRPVCGATETRHPGNQWMANLKATRRLHLEALHAGAVARQYVRGAMDPAYTTPQARDAEVRQMLRAPVAGDLGTFPLVASFLRGWVEHHPEAGADVLQCARTCAYGDDVGIPTSPRCLVHDDYAAHLARMPRGNHFAVVVR